MKRLPFSTFLLLIIFFSACQESGYVEVKNSDFILNNETYKYVGCNYWYGGYIGATNKERLKNELDFLHEKKVTNLRVFICGEGDSTYSYRIYPNVQEQPRQYNEAFLKGFDYFLDEANQRDIKVVFVLNNNWEWSGGFGQYLEWAGKENPPLPKTDRWDWANYCTYIAQFYSNDSCLAWSNGWIEEVVTRRNTINGKLYAEDETIMSWELGNEPRPMKKEATQAYKKWVSNTASFIKSLDQNHLVAIGTEGVISTFNNEDIYYSIHNDKNIDYATLHLWPKTWQWYNGTSDASIHDTTLIKTRKYIEQHAQIAMKLNKPLVIEEFGLHRDRNSFSPDTSVGNRNKYYAYIFQLGQANNINGYNFWGFAGVPANYNANGFMQKGMPYSADPPQEEQGLYSVFMQDTSTWKMINSYNPLIHKLH